MRYETMTLDELEREASLMNNKLALALYEKCHDTLYTEEEMKEVEDAGEIRYDDGYEDGYEAGKEDGYHKGFEDGHNEGWSDAKSEGDD